MPDWHSKIQMCCLSFTVARSTIPTRKRWLFLSHKNDDNHVTSRGCGVTTGVFCVQEHRRVILFWTEWETLLCNSFQHFTTSTASTKALNTHSDFWGRTTSSKASHLNYRFPVISNREESLYKKRWTHPLQFFQPLQYSAEQVINTHNNGNRYMRQTSDERAQIAHEGPNQEPKNKGGCWRVEHIGGSLCHRRFRKDTIRRRILSRQACIPKRLSTEASKCHYAY